MRTGLQLYDAYVNDSDSIGWHCRTQKAVNLTDYMEGEGKDVTLPTLDVDDFIGKSFTTGPDGRLYQLPNQQFANLYWYRKDWFDRPDLPVSNADGTPKWRVAPSPHGPHWQVGMKLGYQDAGSWTLLKGTPAKRMKAAWLYAQFTSSK